LIYLANGDIKLMSEDFYKEATRKARKPHQCWACLLEIPVGANYINSCGVYLGDFFNAHSHIECMEIFRKLSDDGEFECLDYWDEFDFSFEKHQAMIKDKYLN